MTLALTIFSGLLIIAGTLGAILPLPGLPVAWLGLFIYTAVHHFPHNLIWGLVVFGILVATTFIVDIFAPAIAALGHKPSKAGLLGALIGELVGIFWLGPVGALIGPFFGAYIGELIHSSNSQHAFRVATASLFGFVIGTAFKLLVGLSMFVYFIVVVLR